MWVARDKDGTLVIYSTKPIKYENLGAWGNINRNIGYIVLDDSKHDLFPEVKWSDEEPRELVLKPINEKIDMKKIKELNVSVTYEVTLCNIEVSDEVYEALENNDEISTQDCFSSESEKATALDWLSTHVREEDGLEWNYSINNME